MELKRVKCLCPQFETRGSRQKAPRLAQVHAKLSSWNAVCTAQGCSRRPPTQEVQSFRSNASL
jgi:hypothetical protein